MSPGALVENLIAHTELPVALAFLVGLLASIGPCPLATNITALGYTARQFQDGRAIVATSLLYTLGRASAYALVGLLVMGAGAQVNQLAPGLQSLGEHALGPLLLLVGLVFLDLLPLNLDVGSGWLAKAQLALSKQRWLGSFFLGFLFALAFCPYTAALYFGVLLPLAWSVATGWALPAIFGVGTAVPVLLLGLPLALGLRQVGVAVRSLNRLELLVRRGVGFLFLLAALYLIWRSLAVLLT